MQPFTQPLGVCKKLQIGIEIYRSVPVSTVALSVEAWLSSLSVDLVSPTCGSLAPLEWTMCYYILATLSNAADWTVGCCFMRF